MNAYSSLDSVVRATMFEKGEITDHNYDQYLHRGMNFMKFELALGGMLDPTTVRLEIDPSTHVASLPPNYSNWTKIGIVCGNEIINLGINDDMFLNFAYDDCGNISQVQDDCCLGFGIGATGGLAVDGINGAFGYPYMNYIGFGNTIYGKGPFWNGKGYFKVQREQGYIQFSSEVRGFTDVHHGRYAIMEFVTDGLNYSGATNVPNNWVDPCKKYIKSSMAEDDDKMPESKVARRRRDYSLARDRGRDREFKYTVRDYLDAIRSGYTQGPKI